jgi:hypothetical protein
MASRNKGIAKRSKKIMTLSSKIELLDKLLKGESLVSVATITILMNRVELQLPLSADVFA